MARIPFVDTHFHLFDLRHPVLRYVWLTPESQDPELGNMDAIKSLRYWAEDYIAETRFANVAKSIHVQAALGTEDPVEETKWLQAFADKLGHPHGIVAECHLAERNAADVLDRHLQYANVRGIRDFGPGDYLVDPAWQSGLRLLAGRNLVCCLDTRLGKFPQVLKLAAACSEVLICVDHCAIPELRTDEFFRSWKRGVQELARAPNIIMKISGLGMTDHRWTVASFRPYVLTAIEAFGTDRVVFGTNWPVDRLYSSYPDVINAYADIIAGFSEAEQRAMFAGNAERLFRI